MKIVILGTSITSTWANGHATHYRGLLRELYRRGHQCHFLERDMPWKAMNQDAVSFPYCLVSFYRNLDDLEQRFQSLIRGADLVMLSSFVPEGNAVAEWVLQVARGLKVFYDLDTPITLAKLACQDYEYISQGQIPRYDLYLSVTGGPTLDLIEEHYGASRVRPLYFAIDPDLYHPDPRRKKWALGYLGNYRPDRQGALNSLLLEAARQWPRGQFVVAGPQYPPHMDWPPNVTRIEQLPPACHCAFYNEQRFTLNLTRRDMRQVGYAPGIRLFEAAACGTPIISDYWEGLESFFEIGSEILLTRSAEETLAYLRRMPELERYMMGQRARHRVLTTHTSVLRAKEFENYVQEMSTLLVK